MLRAAELRDGLVEGDEVPQPELCRGARGAAVAVDHQARFVARPIGHPRLCAPVREGERHERSSCVMEPDPHASRALLEEHGPCYARGAEVLSELVRQVNGVVDGPTHIIHKDRIGILDAYRATKMLTPGAE